VARLLQHADGRFGVCVMDLDDNHRAMLSDSTHGAEMLWGWTKY
jgi:hypothetical protein